MIDKINYWCHKILPLVYDDSLSYYEVLCKTSAKLNEVITSTNGLLDAWDTYKMILMPPLVSTRRSLTKNLMICLMK